MEFRGQTYVLRLMWMDCPDQTGRLQGHPRESGGGLAGNDSGTGSGWQQSKQKGALPAVVGEQSRVMRSDLCS